MAGEKSWADDTRQVMYRVGRRAAPPQSDVSRRVTQLANTATKTTTPRPDSTREKSAGCGRAMLLLLLTAALLL